MTTQELNSDVVTDILIRGAQNTFINEVVEERKTYLKDYEDYNGTIYFSMNEPNTFIVRALPDVDEETTYQDWLEGLVWELRDTLETSGYELEDLTPTTEEVKAGSWWSLTKVSFN
jgi:hypothetical protein